MYCNTNNYFLIENTRTIAKKSKSQNLILLIMYSAPENIQKIHNCASEMTTLRGKMLLELQTNDETVSDTYDSRQVSFVSTK
jgi:hypothetical protein